MSVEIKFDLGAHLRQRVSEGRKLVVPYLTCGLPTPGEFVDLYVELGAFSDAIEVGIPFSDPVMDGPVIQEASAKALEAGVTVDGCLGLVAEALKRCSTPAVVMTYFNPIHSAGIQRFAAKAATAGVSGLIVPDLPYEECDELDRALKDQGLSLIQLVAPTTPADRAAMLAAASRGWVYVVSRMGVTGLQNSLASAAAEVVGRVKPHTDLPVLIGVGISNDELAVEACKVADGVIVGTAVVKRVLEFDLPGVVGLVGSIDKAVNPAGHGSSDRSTDGC
ncbi:MAG TPA: tryptophan synthase subunit alpha [Actinomycetota bacterium]|nr:tryptophan synthase subunit alpha [Actinomycetota bacterium]